MFLPSCERLATNQPTLASLIQRLDSVLASMGASGEIVAADLAYVLDEDTAQIERVLDELVDLGGLEHQSRLVCQNGCFSISLEEYEEAVAEGEAYRCPECNARFNNSEASTRAVYIIREAALERPARTSNVPDGQALMAGQTYKMVFAAANPDVKPTLALDQEWKRIERRFSQKQCAVEIQKVDRWATTITDLRQSLLDYRPTIVHFSGHGTRQHGLNFMDEGGSVQRVSGQALASLFKLCTFIECVLLNACYSADQADAIAQHIHCVVAMKGEIGDEAAIAFSAGFYDALTAGEPFGRCFQFGLNALELDSLSDVDCPTVWIDGINYSFELPPGE